MKLDILLQVQNLIERCLQLYMTKGEVVRTLSTRARIEPGFTTLGNVANSVADDIPVWGSFLYLLVYLSVCFFHVIQSTSVILLQYAQILPIRLMNKLAWYNEVVALYLPVWPMIIDTYMDSNFSGQTENLKSSLSSSSFILYFLNLKHLDIHLLEFWSLSAYFLWYFLYFSMAETRRREPWILSGLLYKIETEKTDYLVQPFVAAPV